MATCSIFANPVIDTEEGAIALADAYDKFMEEQAKLPPKPLDVEGRDEFPGFKKLVEQMEAHRT